MSNSTYMNPEKQVLKESSAAIPTKKKETGPTVSKKKNEDKGGKKQEVKEEEVEAWWPPFHFDGRNALRSKMCINLRNCQYDLFRTIALNELGWRVVDHRNKVIDAESVKQEEIQRTPVRDGEELDNVSAHQSDEERDKNIDNRS